MVSKQKILKTLKTIKKFQKDKRKTTLNRESKDTKRYDPYKTLISCLLSLRAKDETTEKISEKLFKIAHTPKQIIKIPRKKLEKIIFSSGHYKKKAEAIQHVSQQLLKKHKGQVPSSYEKLLSIKHIGPKTANIVLCFSFNKNVIPVDTHVHRIPNRLGWIKTKTPEKSEIALMNLVPKKYWSEINGLFVLFGKTTCLPISPLCSQCPIRKYCKRINVKTYR
jgi:endonuclease-3